MLEAFEFAALGLLAPAGIEATKLALEQGVRSGERGCVPIAGAAVTRQPDGSLHVSALGANGRIPAPDVPALATGYPTDHGETGAVRGIADVDGVDWASTVFATTLSPCIMCTRTCEHLYELGLRSIVIAEATTFKGAESRLDALPGLTIVRLNQPETVVRMTRFASRYPWDWAADIGEVPPRADQRDALVSRARADGRDWLAQRAPGEASVVGPRGDVLSVATDGRMGSGNNPCHAAVVRAMGQAGSAVNLRECALVWRHSGAVDLAAFGRTSLGACELFRPAVLLSSEPLESDLAAALEAAGVLLLCGGDARAAPAAVPETTAVAPGRVGRARSRSPRGVCERV